MSNTTTAADRAYAVIRDAIIGGTWRADDALREEALAVLADVSRTPVREALRRLDAEGLVAVLPSRGARVLAWDERDVAEIFELRVLLEGFGARLAAGRITEGELAHLGDLCEQMEAVTSGTPVLFDRLNEINADFHQAILGAGGNRRLVKLATSVVERALVSRTFHLYSPQQLARSCAQHRELLDALSAGDADWAEATMQAHLYHGRNTARRVAGSAK